MTRAILEQALLSNDAEARRVAVCELSKFGSESAPALIRALGDNDWRVRKEATRAILDLTPTKELAEAVTVALLPNDNVGLRNAAVEVLAAMGQTAVDALTGAIPGLDADGRKLAADALGQSHLSSALVLLRILASDPDLNVRVGAIESIGHIGSGCTTDTAEILHRALDAVEPIERLSALDAANELCLALDWHRVRPLLSDAWLQRGIWSAVSRMVDSESAQMLVGVAETCSESDFPLVICAIAGRLERDHDSLFVIRHSLSNLSDARRGWLVQLVNSEVTELRRTALLVLAALGDEPSAQVVLDVADDDSLAATAELGLSWLGAAATTLLCERALRPVSDRAQALAIEMLTRHADEALRESVLSTVGEALSSTSAAVLRAAFEFLRQNSSEACFERAYQSFSKAAKLVEASAIGALQSMVLRHPQCAVRLVSNTSVDGPNVLAAVVAMSTMIGVPHLDRAVDTEFLSRALAHESPHVRRVALEALVSCGHASATDIALFALTDEEPEVRRSAVRALGRASDASAMDRLIDIIRVSEDTDLVVAAIRALGESDNPRALQVLRPVARGGSPVVAVAAVEAIGQINDSRRIDALIDSLSHSDVEVVKASLQVLAGESDLRASAHLGACLDHEAWDVRRLAADLLGRIGGDVVNGLLRTKLAIENEPLVREALLRALGDVDASVFVRRNTPGIDPGSWRPR